MPLAPKMNILQGEVRGNDQLFSLPGSKHGTIVTHSKGEDSRLSSALHSFEQPVCPMPNAGDQHPLADSPAGDSPGADSLAWAFLAIRSGGGSGGHPERIS
jgi:hypothetical protein